MSARLHRAISKLACGTILWIKVCFIKLLLVLKLFNHSQEEGLCLTISHP